ncbi:MAG TPA: M23 family metallopeptidase [Sphingomicrobium sp.]|nr:M23 family metallopeptidase [Sphingomicrobium sp.]
MLAGLLIVGTGGMVLAQGVQPVSARSPSNSERSAQLSAPVSKTATDPFIAANEQPSMELFIKLRPDDTIGDLLTRAGATAGDAARAGALIASALPDGLAPGADVTILLGERSESGGRTLQRVTVRAGLETRLAVVKDGNRGLRLVRQEISVDSTPLRFRGRSGAGLYWSMRARGVPAETAAEFVTVISTRLDGSGQLRPDDQFDLVLAHRQASTGESQAGPLLYAAIDRRHGPDVKLVNGSVAGRAGWFDPGSGAGASAGLTWPVAGRVSSRFGHRVHPILRFARFHRGVDVSSTWGSPIVAAADGRVIGSGWNGGHGRQVRIAHDGGLETSYSHMSQIVAAPGARVRQGQLIGYVGSTGFSTGPHLHYEMHDRGRPIDPLRARHSVAGTLSAAELAAVRARLRPLLTIHGSRIAAIPAAGRQS